MTPGPVPVSDAVAAALARPPRYHRADDFAAVMHACHRDIATVVGATAGERVVTWGGTGTMAMESAVVNLLGAGPVVVGVTGSLGQRFAAIVRQYGADPVLITPPDGEAVTPAELDLTLAGLSGAAVVLVQDCDTSTGIRNDLAALASVARRHDAVLVADAVATAGAAPIGMTRNSVDVVLGTSQKGLGCVPGVSIAVVGARAWDRRPAVRRPGYSLDWSRQSQIDGDGHLAGGQTPPVSILAGLEVALAELLGQGLDKVWQRQELVGRGVRSALRAAGFDLVAAEPCAAPMVTTVRVADSGAVLRAMARDHGVVLPTGAAGMVRIGHFLSQAPHAWRTVRALAAVTGRPVAPVDEAFAALLLEPGWDPQWTL
jgi:aspartate aminotransferase-like enzyme